MVDALAVAGQAMVARHRDVARPHPPAPLPGATPFRTPAREAGDRLLRWAASVGVGLTALFLVLQPWLPHVFTDDPAALARVRELLPFVVWMQPLNALVFVWDGIFMGAEDFRFLAVQMVAVSATAAGVLLLVVPMGWGLTGVWWGIVTLMAVRAGTLAGRYRGALEV